MRPFKPRRTRGDRRFGFGALLLEVALIVLGVSLALGANEVREWRSNRQLAQQALASIHDEIARNRAELAEILPVMAQVSDSLYAQRARMRTSDDFWNASGRGMPMVIPEATMWIAAAETDALAPLDYETVATLSRLYTYQDAYRELTHHMMERVYAPELYNEATFQGTAVSMRIHLRDGLFGGGQRLLAAYDSTLSVLHREADLPLPVESAETSAP